MPKLSEVLDVRNLNALVREKFIRLQHHPTDNLCIYNYTDKANYNLAWNHETRICRGLIVDDASNVVAWPFPKFWNIEQHASPDLPSIPWSEPYRIFDKADGSLAIGYMASSGYSIATRGSFDSDPARHATALLRSKYNSRNIALRAAVDGITPLWEIIYPENRIVLDYGDMDDLILLGGVSMDFGYFIPPDEVAETIAWNGPVVPEYHAADLHAERANKEGYVLWFPDSDFQVKVKHEDYKRRHAVLSRCSTKTVWRALRDGAWDEELFDGMPDEVMDFIKEVKSDLEADYRIIELASKVLVSQALQHEPGRDRGLFVSTAYEDVPSPHVKAIRAVAFAILGEKQYSHIIWSMIEPEYRSPFQSRLDSD